MNGFGPVIVKALGEFVRVIKERGVTTLLVEQNSTFSSAFSDREYLLEKGAICWYGSCEGLKGKPEVMK